MSETITLLVGFLLTLIVYSYVVGDNPLYRLAVHLLIGVGAGYAAVIAFDTVFIPLIQRLQSDPLAPGNVLWIIPLLLALLLVLRWIGPLSWVGSTPVGVLITTGAAVALVGAIGGTLVPQIAAAGDDGPLAGLLVALLTVAALFYFQFTGTTAVRERWQPPMWRRAINLLGQGVLMVTFGALFAGAFNTSITLLVERVSYYVVEFGELVSGLFS
jgi:hypothetical protein